MANDNYFSDYKEMFEVINQNSARVRNMEQRKKIAAAAYQLHREKKDKFKKRVRLILVIAVLVTGIGFGTNILDDVIERQKQLNEANSYMNYAINFVCPELDRGVLSDKAIVLFNNDEESYRKICDELQTEFGLSRDCAIYCIAKQYGDDAFDKVTKSYGYEGKDKFLYDYYSRPTSISNSGETVYTKEGSFKVFENNVQVELVNKVNLIKEMMEKKVVESKGMVK